MYNNNQIYNNHFNYNTESEKNYEAVTSIRTQETKDENKNRIRPIPLNLKSLTNSNIIPSESNFTNDDNNNQNNDIEIVSSVRTKTSQDESHSNFEVNLEKINEIKEIESNITDQLNF